MSFSFSKTAKSLKEPGSTLVVQQDEVVVVVVANATFIEKCVSKTIVVLYHFEKRRKAAQSFRNLNEPFGKGKVSEIKCWEWFARFKSGDTSSEDKPERGRTSDFNNQALLAAVEENESLTTLMLAKEFNVNQSTVDRRLKKIRKVWKIAGWFPHELFDNRANRVRMFPEKVCVLTGVSPKGIPKHVHCKKDVWWDRSVCGIDCLPSKWEAVFQVDGDYAPE
ncbi:histone-lysine N-methyltransferase SETMAR [Trichonephila clavipes]|uniref:Histone-lysine N-methyltransferase SETMAR n=1 Tax=Trichonephila clavipes TaxID=2585209 RepID=A0A8X6VHE7_TRICX|nr:histone-lysine N-methyltransferase SETMAR [Trichonephila clavipes]